MAAKHPLRFNVGFIAHEEVGYSRVFDFDLLEIDLSPNFSLESLVGQVRLTRTRRGLLAEVELSALTPVECVRCLDEFEQKIATTFTELYAFDERATDESGLILPENGLIDLAPLIREYAILEIPIKPVCKQDCLGLCPICGNNRNEAECQHDEQPIDPRLSKLQGLLDEDE